MGVPAFFKWLSTKYPKIIADCIEERASWSVNGEHIPIDSSKANPNGVELDNLYLDMNGIIHPASHPEDRPPPETEDDMYLSIFAYLERVFAAARPRKLLFMASACRRIRTTHHMSECPRRSLGSTGRLLCFVCQSMESRRVRR